MGYDFGLSRPAAVPTVSCAECCLARGGSMTRSVGIVGGGAVGVTAAYDLARQGASVTLYEALEIGGGSTHRAAGNLSAAYPGVVNAEIGRRAVERFRTFSGEGDFVFNERERFLFVTEPGQRAEAIREETNAMADRGFDVSVVEPNALADAYPGVRTDDIHLLTRGRGGGWTDPITYAELVADKAREAGAEICAGIEAGVELDPPRVHGEATTEYDAVLVAAGAHTKQLLADAGIPIPMKPYRVQALTSTGPSVPILHDATESYYLRPHPTGLLAGDGTEHVESDPDDWQREGDDTFVDAMETRFAHRFPDHATDIGRAWAGLCTATPDEDPLLGEVADGLYVATGWHGHGFVRSPATGEAVAEEILDGEGIEAFDPTRFDGDEDFEIVEGMSIDED